MMSLPIPRYSSIGLALIVAIAAGCGDDPAAIPSAVLEVAVSTAGTAFDPDGYVILRDGAETYRKLRLIDSVRLSGHPGQSIELELTDVAANCRVDGGAHRTVTFVDGSMPRESFDVECAAPPGLESARLVFVNGPCTGYVAEGCDLHTLPMDGGEGRRLTDDGRSAQPAISADGSTIAFTRLDPGSESSHTDVFAMDVDGANPRPITADGESSDPSWSPDGTRIVYVKGDGYWYASLEIRSLEGGDPFSLSSSAVDWAPVWAPDGSRIAFTRWTGDSAGRGVHTMTPEGTDAVLVAADGLWPVWSPTADRIAYTVNGSPFVIELDAGTRTRLLPRSAGAGWTPTGWSPDGEWIALDRGSAWGATDIYLLRIDDGLLVRATLDAQSSSAVFVPGS